MLVEPIVTSSLEKVAADGRSFSIHEWKGSGPTYLHVHHKDDEAWHVLEGSLHFRFEDKELDAPAGSTVFVPAGVAHTYQAAEGSRYLIFLTPRLNELISRLQGERDLEKHKEIMREFESEILE